MIALAYAIVALVALSRVIELIVSQRNTRALLARGAVEYGRGQYPVIVSLHIAWFVSLIAFVPRPFAMHWIALAAYGVLQVLRLWTMVSLGPWFTTRILTLPGAHLVTTGPYRVMRHPNYAIVVGEIAALPLAFGEIWVAAAFSILNAAALSWRIREEDAALAARRGLTG